MLTELLESDGFSLTRKTATELSSPCPACGGRDRCTVFVDQGKYWCRQCGAHGDALQYLRDFRRMSFKEASLLVGKELSAPSKRTTTPVQRPTEPAKVRPSLWRERAAAVIGEARNNLLKNSEALAWLHRERGITTDTAKRFKLGWLTENHFFKKEEFGLPNDGKKLAIPAGLVIPWHEKRIRVRRISDDDAQKYGRYYVVSGSDSEPMMIGEPYEKTAIIVESELDAILLTQEVKRQLFVVALGSAQVKPTEYLIGRLALCPAALVALDNDAAGAKAALWWVENLPGCHRTLTPSRYGKDFGEAFKQGLDLNAWITAAMTIYASTLTTKDDEKITQIHFMERT
jgi:DNA primase